MMTQRPRCLPIVLLVALCGVVHAEDGSKLWLRYAPVTDARQRESYQQAARQIVVRGNSQTLSAAG